MRKAFTIAVSLVTILCALELLRASFAAYTWGKFTLFDYGVYTNMIWNSGGGDFFRVLMDRNYLMTHLSFTLALLGPLYRLWDHPFLLSLLQWSLFMTGGAALAAALHRRKVRGDLMAALLFFYLAYPYSQSVILSEYHGVSLYLALIPLLYFCLSFKKSLVWLPLLLTLGIREDAFLVILPMLLYFAVRDRWRGGIVYAALSLTYGILAITVIFPLISDMSLLARRSHELGSLLQWETLAPKGKALLWIFLPTVVFIRHRWWTVMLFTSTALAVVVASGFPRQYLLQSHYPAALMACLVTGMAEAIGTGGSAPSGRDSSWKTTAAFWLVGVTMLAYFTIGFLPGGGKSDRIYRRIHPDGVVTLRAARQIPREGTLIVPGQLAGFVANRADLLTWRTYDPAKHSFDLVFSDLRLFSGTWARTCLQLMGEGSFGVRYFDGDNFILQRGFPTERNDELQLARLLARSTIRIANTYPEEGPNVEVPGARSARFWQGSQEGSGTPLAYGRSIRLAPGPYEARLHLRSARPAAEVAGGWGRLTLHVPGVESPIAESQIEKRETPPGTFRVQVLNFELAETTKVEPRIWGGAAPLWLKTIVFAPAGGN